MSQYQCSLLSNVDWIVPQLLSTTKYCIIFFKPDCVTYATCFWTILTANPKLLLANLSIEIVLSRGSIPEFQS